MLVAIQSGDRDRDPYQTRRHMRDMVGQSDNLIFLDQPNTMMDQIKEIGADVTKITPDFMKHGTAAIDFAMNTLVSSADRFLLLAGSNDLCPIDKQFLSYVYFYGHKCRIDVAQYERIVVL